MKLSTPFKRVGSIEESAIAVFAETIELPDWDVLDYRRSMVAHHGDYISMVFRHSPEYSVQSIRNLPLYDKYKAALIPILAELEKYYRIDDYVALAANLKTGAVVLPHKDSGDFLERIHRVHIPITSNNDAYYSVDGVDLHMPVGSIYEIDNQRTHSVRNLGSTDRVHLIVNIFGEPL